MQISSSILDLKSAITRNPRVVTPQTTVEDAIANMEGPPPHCIVTPEKLGTVLTKEFQAELRTRYLVVVDHQNVIGLLTAQDILACKCQAKSTANLTIGQCITQPFATLSESALKDPYTPLNLLGQHRMRPIVILDEHHQLAGLLTYEQLLHTIALASPAQTTAVATPVSEKIQQPIKRLNPIDTSIQREQVINKITAQVHSSSDIQTVLDMTVTELRAILECDRVITYQIRADLTGKVIAESVDTSSHSVLHREVHEPYITHEWLQPYQQGKICIVDDIDEAEMTACYQTMLIDFGIRSTIMLPIIVEGEIWGFILTSEQDTPRQWQPAEVELVRQVGLQVAISVQQGHAYQRAQLELAERRKAEQQLQKTLDVTATKTGTDFFPTSVMLLAESLGVAHVLLTERHGDTLRTLAYVIDQDLQNTTFEYKFVGTPCEHVLKTGGFYCRCDIQDLFPDDLDLVDLGVESYLGFAMQDSQGEVVGHLCALDRKPLERSERTEKLIRSFAARASAELERQKAINALETLNQELEAKVAVRTADLQASYQQLKDTQVQLMQSEKMSSLGQLVAGVAHEINNPVSFIYGNLNPCLEYVDALSHLISLYQKHYSTPHPEISEFIEAADIQYTLGDFPKLINSMQTGATRIQAIVQSLRTFSYSQQEGHKAINIHDNIDNTLVILQNRLNGRAGNPAIEVVKDYGKLPLVECYGGLLNQVFMNLLVNGIDAIEQQQKFFSGHCGCLTITTTVMSSEKVAITIRDNGIGMASDVKDKIFNPFFTTKPVGIGTGMGLSISYKIVIGDHQGQFYCSSVVGEGTEFIIELPIHMAI